MYTFARMRSRFHWFILLTCAALHVQGQTVADNWYFGINTGITFNSGIPEPLTGSMMQPVEGCASLSNLQGDLLFYSDGVTVWNKNHEVMPNGTGLISSS